MVTEWAVFTEQHRAECPEQASANLLASQGAKVAFNREATIRELLSTKPNVICRKNKTRQRLNRAFADLHRQQGSFGMALPPFEVHKYSREKQQDFTYQVGMPV